MKNWHKAGVGFFAAICALTATAGEPSGSVPIGNGLVSGPVMVNGRAVFSTVLLAAGDRVETRNGTVVLNAGARDRLIISEQSAVVLRRGPLGIGAELVWGRVLVDSAERLHEVRFPNEAISIQGPLGEARQFVVSRLKDASYVIPKRGSVVVTDEGYGVSAEIHPGMAGVVRRHSEQLEARSRIPQRPAGVAAQPVSATGRRAGQITAVIPADTILRGQKRLPGDRGEEIQWLDEVQTESKGRVRIKLDDGSILSLGQNSRLKVTEHDPSSQRTSLEIQYGKIRAQVAKLAQANSSFEIRTATAICGVLGTDFYLEADARQTKLIVFEGRVSFRPLTVGIAAAAIAATTVLAGQTSTAVAGSVAAPVASGASATSAAMGATTVGQAAASTATTGVLATTAGRIGIMTAAAIPAAATVAGVTSGEQANPGPSTSSGIVSVSRP